MELEWDEEKRQRNLRERGIDFAEAIRFELGAAFTEQDLRFDYGEHASSRRDIWTAGSMFCVGPSGRGEYGSYR